MDTAEPFLHRPRPMMWLCNNNYIVGFGKGVESCKIVFLGDALYSLVQTLLL